MTRYFYDKRVREIFWQAALLIGLAATIVLVVRNASQNMVNAGMASGFDFLWRTSGIDVPFVLTNYTPASNILALLWVGVANTLVITFVAVIAATLLGFVVGIARLSPNKLLSGLAGAYIEFVRNIPLLFSSCCFWYFGVIAALPGPRQSIGHLLGGLPQQSRPDDPRADRRLGLPHRRPRRPCRPAHPGRYRHLGETPA